MCKECRQYPCHPRCPNAPEPAVVCDCEHCNKPIRSGDEYFEYDGKHYHENCFADAAPALVAEDGAKRIDAIKDSRKFIGVCKHCNEAIIGEDVHWKYGKDLYHDECFLDCAQIILEDETSHGTAEEQEYEPEYDPGDKYDV